MYTVNCACYSIDNKYVSIHKSWFDVYTYLSGVNLLAFNLHVVPSFDIRFPVSLLLPVPDHSLNTQTTVTRYGHQGWLENLSGLIFRRIIRAFSSFVATVNMVC